MRAALVLTALLLAAVAASAQPVTLRLWRVPDGARVCGTSMFSVETTVTTPDSVSASSARLTACVCWSGFATRDGRLVAAREVLTHLRTADAPEDVDDPLLGDTLQLDRQPGGAWAARLRHGTPTQDEEDILRPPFAFDLDDVYTPESPVSVGESWSVSAPALARAVGPIRPGAPFHYTVRLDSLGERNGHRVAFVTHDGTFSLGGSGRTTMHKSRVAAIDLETGLETWAVQALDRQFEFETRDARGKPAVTRLASNRRSETERTVEPRP